MNWEQGLGEELPRSSNEEDGEYNPGRKANKEWSIADPEQAQGLSFQNFLQTCSSQGWMKKGWRMCLSLCTLCGLTAKFPILNRYCGFKQRIQGWEGGEKPRDWQQEHEEEDIWTQEIVCHHGSMVAHKNVNQHQKCQLGPLQDKAPGGLGEQYPIIGVPIGSTGSNRVLQAMTPTKYQVHRPTGGMACPPVLVTTQ